MVPIQIAKLLYITTNEGNRPELASRNQLLKYMEYNLPMITPYKRGAGMSPNNDKTVSVTPIDNDLSSSLTHL